MTSTFRSDYLDHAALTSQLRTWAEKHSAFCKLLSIGKSGEGRDLWVLAIGREPERARPALWVDGNMHAMELTGSSIFFANAGRQWRTWMSVTEKNRGGAFWPLKI